MKSRTCKRSKKCSWRKRSKRAKGSCAKKSRRISIPQTHGCLVMIDGGTQKNWQHSIKKTQKIIGPRINLTFRNIIA
jgi:alkylated DNA repair dioxygenase AlkB